MANLAELGRCLAGGLRIGLLFVAFWVGFLCGPYKAVAGNPGGACYCSLNNRVFWFIQISDLHIGIRGNQDSLYLEKIVNQARKVIEPEFIIASGDLTDSTNGSLLGVPDGPWQDEWDEYSGILAAAGMTADFYYDIPGNHDAYSDADFAYYLANSIQGRATGQTQISWIREFSFGKYQFLGVNTADHSGDPFSFDWPWGDYAGLDEDELDFIESRLAESRDADLTLVFGHHPVTDTGYDNDTWLFYGAQEFVGLLDDYGASFYGYGHTHRFSETIFAGDDYTGQMSGQGLFYLNVASLGESDNWHYAVAAIDCNGISLVSQSIDDWPVVLITTPLDQYRGDALNPYAYTVPASAFNPLRALAFDTVPFTEPATALTYRIDNTGEWLAMQPVAGQPHLWEATWDASGLDPGDHLLSVRAHGTTTRSDTITVRVAASTNFPPVITGQQPDPIQLSEEDSLTVDLADLVVIDPDSQYPDDFTLTLYPGEHYQLSGSTTIVPEAGFSGLLLVPLTINDGQDDSHRFLFKVAVTSVFYVESGGSADPYDGVGCGGEIPCYNTIQAGLESAALRPADSSTIVRVATGTYSESLDFSVPGQLLLEGGWASDFSVRPMGTFCTVNPGEGLLTLMKGQIVIDGLAIE